MAYNRPEIDRLSQAIGGKINVIDPNRNEAIKDIIKLSDCFPIPDDPIGDFGTFFVNAINNGIENDLITPAVLGCETQEELAEELNNLTNEMHTMALNLPLISILFTDPKKLLTTVYYPYDDVLEQMQQGDLTDDKLNNIVNNHKPHLLSNNVRGNAEYLPMSEFVLATLGELINNTVESNPNSVDSFENVISELNEALGVDEESSHEDPSDPNPPVQKEIVAIVSCVIAAIALGLQVWDRYDKEREKQENKPKPKPKRISRNTLNALALGAILPTSPIHVLWYITIGKLLSK